MSVYKTPKSPYWQYDFQWKGRRFYGSTGCTARRAAEAVEARIRHDAISRQGERPPVSLDNAAGLYAAKVDQLPSWPTVRPMLAALVEGLGKRKLLSEISQSELRRFVARRRDGRENSSVNREIEVWRALWRWAARQRHDVGEMPDWGALFLPVDAHDPRELSAEEEERLFAALRPDHHAMVRFALRSGWRLSEVINLLWSDVQPGERIARTRLKGGKVASRPLSRQMLAIITSQPKVCAHVFTYVCQASRTENATKDGRQRAARRKGERYPYSKTGWRKAWRAALKEADISNLRFHDLRHTAGTRILRATGNLQAAKAALKHQSIKTTLRYAHVLDEDVRAAYDAADSRNSPGRTHRSSRKR